MKTTKIRFRKAKYSDVVRNLANLLDSKWARKIKYTPSKKQFAIINKSPDLIFKYARMIRRPYEKGEKVLSKNIKSTLNYLLAFHKQLQKFPNRLEILENSIAKDTYASVRYAEKINKRFEKGEKAISKNAEESYYYARFVLKNRFELGENAIIKEVSTSIDYVDVIGRFLKAEPMIKRSGFWTEYMERVSIFEIEKAKRNNVRISDKSVEKWIFEHEHDDYNGRDIYKKYFNFIKNLVSSNLHNGEEIIKDFGDFIGLDRIVTSLSKNHLIPDEINNFMIAKGIIDSKQTKNYLVNKNNFNTKIKSFLNNYKDKTVEEVLNLL